MNVIQHEVFIIGSENSVIKWFISSDDFPRMKHKFKCGNKLPKNALANQHVSGISSIIDSLLDDWFETWGGKSERDMYEQCYSAEAYGQIITLLWYL